MKRIFSLLIILAISGCASVSVQRFSKELVYPPTHPASIVVFPDKPSGKDFIELGEITVTGANEWPQVEKIFKDKAAEMGGDAVYVFNQKEETSEFISPGECYVGEGYYYPYHHFGWNRYHPNNYYPRGYYYCYGYQSTLDSAVFISAVGIVIKYQEAK